MFKRILAFGLAALMLMSDVPAIAYAQTASEAIETPFVPADSTVVSEETQLSELGVVISDEREEIFVDENTFSIYVNNPTSDVITADAKVVGYGECDFPCSAEYLYMYLATSEDGFDNYVYEICYPEFEWDATEQAWYARYDYLAAENTTYYVKFCEESVEGTQYGKTATITTEGAPQFTYTLTQEVAGNAVTLYLFPSGYARNREMRSYLEMHAGSIDGMYAKDEEFSDASGFGFDQMYVEEDVPRIVYKPAILEYDTTYYVKFENRNQETTTETYTVTTGSEPVLSYAYDTSFVGDDATVKLTVSGYRSMEEYMLAPGFGELRYSTQEDMSDYSTMSCNVYDPDCTEVEGGVQLTFTYSLYDLEYATNYYLLPCGYDNRIWETVTWDGAKHMITTPEKTVATYNLTYEMMSKTSAKLDLTVDGYTSWDEYQATEPIDCFIYSTNSDMSDYETQYMSYLEQVELEDGKIQLVTSSTINNLSYDTIYYVALAAYMYNEETYSYEYVAVCDPVSFTTGVAPVLEYEHTAEVLGRSADVGVKIAGYADENEYYNYRRIEYFWASTSEIMEDYIEATAYNSYDAETGVIYAYAELSNLEYATDYYVVPVYYDNATGMFVNATEAQKITTAAELEIDYNLTAELTGKTSAKFDLTVDGYASWDEYQATQPIQCFIYSINSEMSDYETQYMSYPEKVELDNGKIQLIISGELYNLSYGTTYYVAPAAYVYSEETYGYEYVPVCDPVSFTTEAEPAPAYENTAEVIGRSAEVGVKISGYASSDEYYNHRRIESFRVSTSETMESYEEYYADYRYDSETGCIYAYANLSDLEYETDYYVVPVYRDDITGEYVNATAVQKITILAKVEAVYHLTTEITNKTTVKFTLTVDGYTSRAEYEANGPLERFLYATNSDMSGYETAWLNTPTVKEAENGKVQLVFSGTISDLDYDTTYYMAPAVYDNSVSDYVTVCTPVTVTTEAAPVLSYENTIETIGKTAEVGVKISGYQNADEYYEYRRIRYFRVATVENMETYEQHYAYYEHDEQNGCIYAYANLSELEYATDYYVVPVYYDTATGTYVQATAVQKFTTSKKVEAVYNLTYEMTSKIAAKLTMTIDGYASLAEYDASERVCYVMYSTNADMSDSGSMFLESRVVPLENGKIQMVLTGTLSSLKHGTTYYIAPAYYDSAIGNYVAAGTPISLTTEEAPILNYENTAEVLGRTAEVSVKISGYENSSEYYSYRQIQYYKVSTSATMEDYQEHYGSIDYDSVNGYVEYSVYLSDLEYETDYYVVPVYYDEVTSAYVNATEVQKITTPAKVEATYGLTYEMTDRITAKIILTVDGYASEEEYWAGDPLGNIAYSTDPAWSECNSVYPELVEEKALGNGKVQLVFNSTVTGLNYSATYYVAPADYDYDTNIYTPLTEAISFTVAEAPVLRYENATETLGRTATLGVKIYGYENRNEYSHYKTIEYFKVSTSENMENYRQYYASSSYHSKEGYVLVKADLTELEYRTDYYAVPVYYDTVTGTYMDAAEPVKFTTEAAIEAAYDVSYEVEGNVIVATIVVDGYEDYEEYTASDPIDCIMVSDIAENDFTDSDTYKQYSYFYDITTRKLDNGKCRITIINRMFGYEYDTTYYVAPYWESYNENLGSYDYKAVTAPQAMTTMSAPELSYEFRVTPLANTLELEYRINGYRAAEEYDMDVDGIGYSANVDFSDFIVSGFTHGWDEGEEEENGAEEDGAYVITGTISNLEYETDYYVGLVAFDYDQRKYVPVTEVKKATTPVKPTPLYNLQAEVQERNDINVTVTVNGYVNYEEYSNVEYIRYIGISETADFNSCEQVYCSASTKNLENGKVEIILTAKGRDMKYSTTYYMAPFAYVYDEATDTYKYKQVAEAVSVTTEPNRILDCELVCETPSSNLITPYLTIRGYEDWNDYQSSETIQIQVSESASFEDYVNIYRMVSNKTENGEFVVTFDGYHMDAPNKDYYIRAVRSYRYAEDGWEVLTDVIKVTTKDWLNLDASLKVDVAGSSYVQFGYEVSGVKWNVISDWVKVQLSTTEDFSTTIGAGHLQGNTPEYGATTLTGSCKWLTLNSETTYYARLVFDTRDGYTPVNEQVVTFTTLSDAEYEDSVIPDAAFRQAIKNQLGMSSSQKLTRSALENISYLNVGRDSISQAAIKDITGIELMPCLTDFNASYQEITDISPLANVKGLRYVYLSYNEIQTLPDLNALTNLQYMDLTYNFMSEEEVKGAPTKLTAQVATEYWISDTAEKQRITEQAGLVVADTYYQTAENVYPIQVEINNVYPISEYTLSIYEGENLLKELTFTSYDNEYYAVKGWVVDEFATEAGECELTFVVYRDGEEESRNTKKVIFDGERIYLNGNKYHPVNSEAYYVRGYLYGTLDEVTEVVLLSETGTVAAKVNDINSHNNSYYTDRRYDNIFKMNQIYVSECREVYGTAYFGKMPVDGKYDIRFAMEDGTTYTVEDAVCVTGDAVLSNLYLTSEYPMNGENGEVYVEVNGYNMPFDKVNPVLYDEAGNVLTKSVEYKLISTTSAVYRLELLEGQEWSDRMKLQLETQSGITVLEQFSSMTALSEYPHVYYVEHIPSTEQIRVLVENVEEGVEYEWVLSTGYGEHDQVASCVAAVQNGEVVLELVDAEGNKFCMQPDEYYYYLFAEVNRVDADNSYTLYETVYNYNYTGSGSSYNTNMSTNIAFVNNGEKLEEGYYGRLQESLLTEETELTTVFMIYNEENNEWEPLNVTEGTIQVEQKLFTNSSDETKYWGLKLTVDGITFESGRKYQVIANVGEQNIGTFTLYSLDPAKPAYSYRYFDGYFAEQNELLFDVRGYWPENLDNTKLGVRLTDAVGNVLFEGAASEVKLSDNEYENETYSYRYLQVSLGDMLKDIEDYTRIYFEITYDGEVIAYQRGETNKSSFYIGDESEAWFFSEYPDGKYYQDFYYAVYNNTEDKSFEVKIYKPYDTEVLKTVSIPKGMGEYKFTEADLAGLKYNDTLERYDILLLDESGKLISWGNGYLQAEEKQEAESVSLNKTVTSITVGESEILVATVTPAVAVDTSVTYMSSNPAVATVDNNGKVTAVAVGTAVITVGTINGKTATCTVTVLPIEVAKLELSDTTLELKKDSTAVLTVTVSPENAADKSVTFKSSDTSVVTVDAEGKVTAVKIGTAVITATASNGVSATCTVTVLPVEVAKIELNTTTLGLTKGKTAVLTAVVYPENAEDKSVTFESSNPAVVTVDAEGKLTAVEAGSATITVKTSNGISATCTVEVVTEVIEPTEITFNKTEVSLEVGKSEGLSATITPANATERALTYTSSDESIAAVDAEGKVTAVKVGTATITVSTSNGKTATCIVTVVAQKILPTAIAVSKTELSLEMEKSETLSVSFTPVDTTETAVSYRSADESVATVDAGGKVTAVKVGTTTITVTSVNGLTATCIVTVLPIEATKIELNSTTLGMVMGNTAVLTATVSPENATDKSVTFTSSNPAVVTVDAEGKLTAVGVGTATITAKTTNGLEATCTVEVVAEKIEPTEISMNKNAIFLEIEKTESLSVTITPANATERTVTYTSSDESIATVDAEGKVTAVKVGTATITATTANGKTATCTVTVLPIEATKIELNITTVALSSGNTTALIATVSPENATDKSVTFTSANPAVVTVDAEGKLTAVGVGTAIVTAKTTNGLEATCTVTVENQATLADVPEGWQLTAAQYVYDKGLMNGIGKDKNGDVVFAPDDQLKREMLAQILFAAEGKQKVVTDKNFDDLVNGQWYVDAVLWAAEKEIVSGIGGGKFGVGVNITREQLALMLYKYAQIKGYDTSERQVLTDFADNSDVNTWSREALEWAVANGVMSGTPDAAGNKYLKPQGEATRAQCAAMLRSFMVKFTEE